MKRIPILLFLLLSSSCLIAQNLPTDTSAPVVAYWKKGDKKNFTITKTIERVEAGKPPAKTSNSYSATLSVKDSAADSFTMEWVYNYDDSKMNRPAGMEYFFNKLKVIYKTDEVGSFKELVNFDEMKAYTDKAFSTLISLYKDTTGMSTVMSQVKQIFSSRESVEQILLREISLYHSPFGIEYGLSKYVAETALPNFLGGDPWPATMTVFLAKKPTATNALVHFNMELDKEKAGVNIRKFIEKLGASMGKTIPENEMPGFLEIKDHSEFDVILETGWIKRAYVKRIGKVGDLTKTETLTVEMK